MLKQKTNGPLRVQILNWAIHQNQVGIAKFVS
uniref:Uncharacterized protein n=1 Tax=Anguilla anguilla TaxID=7936 RepID=A0A0E9TPM0_ANGAN